MVPEGKAEDEVTKAQSGSLAFGFARLFRARREVAELAELDDYALRDIGLTRSDVAGALAASPFRNPSLFLKQVCCGQPLRVSEVQTCC